MTDRSDENEPLAAAGVFRRDVLLSGVIAAVAAVVSVADLTQDDEGVPAARPGQGAKTMDTSAARDGTEIYDTVSSVGPAVIELERKGREP